MTKKNLIYFSIDNHTSYITLAEMCVNSLLKTGYTGDILFITNKFEQLLRERFKNIAARTYFMQPTHVSVDIEKCNNILITDDRERVFSSANKLKIFDFKHINKYEKILYCDIDILWLKSSDNLFNVIEPSYISLSEEHDLMSKDYYSANLMTLDEFNYINNNNIKGCSGGIFGFHSKDVHIVKEIYKFFMSNLDKVEGLFEQPFINTYLFRNKAYNCNFSSHVDHQGYYVTRSNKSVLHFAGGPGLFAKKIDRMQNYMYTNNLKLNDKIDIIYRCCESETQPPFKRIRPKWFNKLKCLETFLHAVDKSQHIINSITFIHDGKRGQLYNAIPKTFKIECIDFNNNEKSLLKTFDVADSLTGDYIYFVEDDYLHQEDSISTIYNGVKHFKLVSGYDHLDRYIRDDDVSKDKESVAFLNETNCHWRTVESICCTWASTRDMWNAIKDSARHYKLEDRKFFRNLIKNNVRLWTPIPGVTTQVDDKLSPGINWSILHNDYLKNHTNAICFDSREDMFKTFARNLKIAEIGVFAGNFSNFIYKHLKPAELHLIDLFEGQVISGDKNGNFITTKNLNVSYDELSKLYSSSPNVFLHKGYSFDILNKFEDNYFDVIYIDGDHSYQGVRNDLMLSFQKIKNGGYICGHDYAMNPNKTKNIFEFGVQQAVDEFCETHQQSIDFFAMDGCVGFGIKIQKS